MATALTNLTNIVPSAGRASVHLELIGAIRRASELSERQRERLLVGDEAGMELAMSEFVASGESLRLAIKAIRGWC